MSSSVNPRDYAGAGHSTSAYDNNGARMNDDEGSQPNYAWPSSHRAAHTQPRMQPALQDHSQYQPIPPSFDNSHESSSRYSQGNPSGRQSDHQLYQQSSRDNSNGQSAIHSSSHRHAMPPSGSQSSNLRINSDNVRGTGPSRTRQDPAQHSGSHPGNQSPSTHASPQMSPSLQAHSRQTSNATTLSPSTTARHHHHHPTDVSPTPMRPPIRSRIFGLTTDMRPQTELADPAFFPGGVVPPEAATLAGSESSKEQPSFSVELLASSFDHRGYPVYSGRAALIRGIVRMRKSEQADVSVKLTAHTTSGAAAAVWDGVALQPVESGSERHVFSTTDTFESSSGRIEQISPSPLATPTQSSSSSEASNEDENRIIAVPFAVNLPLGCNSRQVEGQNAVVAVALPPSFEMSSDQDNRDKATLRGTSTTGGLASGGASVKTSRTRMTAITLRDAVENGLQQVYRIGCFYRLTVTLEKPKGQERDRKASGGFFKKSRNKKSKADHLSIPFVFMGEITTRPPLPISLPLIPPAILREPKLDLAAGWVSDRASAKWSGMLFRTLKRTVDLQLFLPGLVLQAPSAVPILLIIRPEDPDMLPPATNPGSTSLSHPGSPRPGPFRHDPLEGEGAEAERLPVPRHSGFSPVSSPIASPGVGDYTNRQLGSHSETPEENQEEEMLRSSEEHSSVGTALSRMIRSSLSISRNAGKEGASSSSSRTSPTDVSHPAGGRDPAPTRQAKRQTSRSTFSFGRRPNTAPSRSSSEGSPVGTEASFTIRGGASSSGASSGVNDLAGLVRVSLVQSVYYSSSNVNDPPKCKRRLVSVADLEEIDLERAMDGKEPAFLPGQPNAFAALTESKAKGVRVLRGMLRVGREATPTFRVQSIELKYAVKVDLLPFNSKWKGHGRSSNPSTSPPQTPPGRPSMHAGNLTPTATQGSSRPQGLQQQGSSSASNWSPPHVDSSRQSIRGGQGSVIGGLSEAGWTKRSPSDQTVMATENSRISKGVGSLWINVRMVEGRGSL
ncbi:unnamed protein product [Sympodiomycopsis kandeliae]